MVYHAERNKEHPYFCCSLQVLHDKRLSGKAKSILMYLLSKPKTWIVRETDIVNNSTDGAEAVRSGMKELRKAGYIKKTAIRENGKFIRWETDVHEIPLKVVEPEVEEESLENNHNVVKPDVVIPTSGSTNLGESRAIVSNKFLVSNDVLESIKKEKVTYIQKGASAPQPESYEQDGFNLSGKTPKPKKTSYTYLTAQKILEALVVKRRISPAGVNLNKWAEDLRKMMIQKEITREDIEPVLDWWIENIDGQFTPQVYAAKSFVDKFDKLRVALIRSQVAKPNPEADREERYRRILGITEKDNDKRREGAVVGVT